jgi:Type VI secretion system/phage-baseplate injector OB domain
MIKDSSGANRAYGIYRGTVVDNRDPLSKNRLRVKVPQLFGTNTLDWAWPREDASTRVAPPVVGQGVLVMFEGGDVAFPIWVGTFGKIDSAQIQGNLTPVTGALPSYPYFVTKTTVDGNTEIDIIASLIAMANKLHEIDVRPDIDPTP